MKRTPWAVLFLLGACAAAAGGAERDAKADMVGRELIAALGGAAWEKARFYRFDFVVEREGKRAAQFGHAWDRYTGDYRLMGTNKAGAPFAVYFNVNTKEGRAFVNGRPVEGEERDVLVQRLNQAQPGQLGKITRRMAEAGVNIEVLYSNHDHQLILVVDDIAKRAVSEAWMREQL